MLSRGTLVVIDMQKRFMAANDPDTITNVCELVQEAMDNRDGIVVLEFVNRPPSPTHAEIMTLLHGYPKYRVMQKSKNDGSPQVLEAVNLHGYDETVFRVCGVNARACVRETVLGLTQIFPFAEVEIIAKACNCMKGKEWAGTFFEWTTDAPSTVKLCA